MWRQGDVRDLLWLTLTLFCFLLFAFAILLLFGKRNRSVQTLVVQLCRAIVDIVDTTQRRPRDWSSLFRRQNYAGHSSGDLPYSDLCAFLVLDSTIGINIT